MLVAVVTGASRGLGRQIALQLGKAGFAVAVNYHQSDKEAAAVASLIGPHACIFRADVGNSREVEEMAEKICADWGRIDVLVNNAGIAKDGLLLNYSMRDWDEVIRINLKGCFNTMKSFVPLMIDSGGGHIVNISSYSGLRGNQGQVAYSASKGALIGLTRAAAREFSGYNIKVNVILPGYMRTDMGMTAPDALETAREESIMKSLSDPLSVAEFVTHLVSTTYMTGQVFSLDSRI